MRWVALLSLAWRQTMAHGMAQEMYGGARKLRERVKRAVHAVEPEMVRAALWHS